MKRREFITLLGGTGFFWSGNASAELSQRMRRVSLLLGLAEGGHEAKSRVQDSGWA
jgi:hypothetical protein